MIRPLTLILSLALITPSSASTIVAYWNQNSNALPGGGFGFIDTAFPQSADQGLGSLTVGGGITAETIVNGNGDTVYRWIQSFVGNLENALPGDPSGGSIALQTGTFVPGTGQLNNGAYFQFEFSMANLEDLEVSYATQRTGTGFQDQTWSWSTDGVTFTDFNTVDTIPTSFGLVTLPTLNALDDATTAYLRVMFDNIPTTATNNNGNNRLDNILFMASAIPEPSRAILFALGGLLLIARRKR